MRRRTPDDVLGAESRDRGPSPRPLQIASVVMRAVQGRLLRGLGDPRLQGMVSIVGVDMSADLARATVRVSVFPADRGPLSLSALRSAASVFRGVLRDDTSLRRPPELVFVLDESLKRQAAIEDAARQTEETE